jgi:para-nitrobenzyl esterase
MTMEPIAKTTSGRVRGYLDDGIGIFKGIRYGASTAGAGRFQPPGPPAPWTGIADALEFGPACPQAPTALRPQEAPTLVALFDAPISHPQSEDLLTLNVWTPDPHPGGKRPVIVHLHAGAFQFGWAAWSIFDGTALARKGDVVVVSLTYRIGVLGFLHLAGLGGDKYAHSGNAGLLDVVAALRWVRDNIAEFGGDPGNVTLLGESAGGGAVNTLLAMPAARGLIHKAMTLSAGGSLGIPADNATQVAQALLMGMGCDRDDLSQLHELSGIRLVRGQIRAGSRQGRFHFGGTFRLGPVIDGTDVPENVFSAVEGGRAPDIPMVIGSTKDEMTLLGVDILARLNEYGMRDILRGMLGDRTDEVLAVYQASRPGASLGEVLLDIWAETSRMPALALAEARIKHGTAPTYVYFFRWESPAENGKYKSTHILDAPFWFSNVDAAPITRGGDERYLLADQMTTALATFARTGAPGHPGLPSWPAYDLTDRPTMVLDAPARLENDPLGAERAVMSAIPLEKLSGRGM